MCHKCIKFGIFIPLHFRILVCKGLELGKSCRRLIHVVFIYRCKKLREFIITFYKKCSVHSCYKPTFCRARR